MKPCHLDQLHILKILLTIALGLCSSLTYSNVLVLNGLTHIHEVVKGNIYEGTIKIQNPKNEAQAVRIYQKDYRFYHTGETLYDEPTSHDRSNAPWIELSSTYVELQPKETRTLQYKLSTPNEAHLHGSFWSVVMIESLQPVREMTSLGVHINSTIRYAIQIVSNFGNSGLKELTFTGAELIREESENVLQVDIENTGERMLLPQLILELLDETGKSLHTFRLDALKSYPYTSLRFRIPLEGVNAGEYNALLIADCSDDDLFGTKFLLEIIDE
jgi:hypothetical protein